MSHSSPTVDDSSRGGQRVRIDRWLWAARFYKTRSIATTAVAGGKVRLNDQRPKPGAPVRVGDRVTVRKGAFTFDVVVVALSKRRGRAAEARELYDETPESIAERERRRSEMKTTFVPTYEGKGRPTKKERRELDRLRRDFPDLPDERG